MLSVADLKSILNKEKIQYSSTGNGESVSNVMAPTMGVVVDTDDPLEQGRMRVFCPAWGDSVKKLHHLPWALYISPFGGTINSSSFTRGNDPGNATSNGAISYGFWGIPEQGSLALVATVDGDIRKRVWMGSTPNHQESNTINSGRWKADGQNFEGPFTSGDSPIQPIYDNMSEAFQGMKDSAEWKTRAFSYQTSAIFNSPPNQSKSTYVDDDLGDFQDSERDEWVKPILGEHGYDWSGLKSVGSHKNSRVFGMTTPGFHNFTMDDRPFNNRIGFRSSTGHVVLLDDTNERIYVATNKGKNYVEMDSSGNIDVYSERRISVHSEKDMNFSSDETIRFKANKGMHFYSGDKRGQYALEETPEDGQIRFHSVHDTHFITEKSFRFLSEENSYFEIGDTEYKTIGNDKFEHINGNYNLILNEGNYNRSIGGTINSITKNDYKHFSGGEIEFSSRGQLEIFSFENVIDIGSKGAIAIKSYDGDVSLESLSGDINLVAPRDSADTSFISLGQDGISIFSPDTITMSGLELIFNGPQTFNPPLMTATNPLAEPYSSSDSVDENDSGGILMGAIGDIPSIRYHDDIPATLLGASDNNSGDGGSGGGGGSGGDSSTPTTETMTISDSVSPKIIDSLSENNKNIHWTIYVKNDDSGKFSSLDVNATFFNGTIHYTVYNVIRGGGADRGFLSVEVIYQSGSSSILLQASCDSSTDSDLTLSRIRF